jgi:hypothetical protein
VHEKYIARATQVGKFVDLISLEGEDRKKS